MNKPISIHPGNNKIFLFRDKPMVLVCATEHYGAVMNRPFDFEKYLDDARDKKQTLTRLFILFRELQTEINPHSPCKPESPDYISPYMRTGPGKALDCEPKYDLDKWNDEFFQRLHSFLKIASAHGIIVEVTILSNTYSNLVWSLNPLNNMNNINDVEKIDWPEYITLRNPGILKRQLELVEKIVTETNQYDNVIYEVCNEPGGEIYGKTTVQEVNSWISVLIKKIRSVEALMPNQHLICGHEAFIYEPVQDQKLDLSFDSIDNDVVNVHPLAKTSYGNKSYDLGYFMAKQLRIRQLREFCAALIKEKKAVNVDEDNAASQYKDYDGWTIHRKRAWTVIFSGCHYDYIDFSINIYNETGTEMSQKFIRSWMKNLSTYLHDLDLVNFLPLVGFVKCMEHDLTDAVLCVRDKEFHIYLVDPLEIDEEGYGGIIKTSICVDLTEGAFFISCYSPQTGEHSPAVKISGGAGSKIILPEFRHDIVVKISKI